ncbi:hypothetical protein [Streptomyces malaysiensis]
MALARRLLRAGMPVGALGGDPAQPDLAPLPMSYPWALAEAEQCGVS